MIRCFMDPSVPQESNCAKCCIYCEEECVCRCDLAIKCETEDKVIEADCCHAYEDGMELNKETLEVYLMMYKIIHRKPKEDKMQIINAAKHMIAAIDEEGNLPEVY